MNPNSSLAVVLAGFILASSLFIMTILELSSEAVTCSGTCLFSFVSTGLFNYSGTKPTNAIPRDNKEMQTKQGDPRKRYFLNAIVLLRVLSLVLIAQE